MKLLIRLINAAFYCVLIFVLVVLAGIHGGALWLGSDGGTYWVKTQIEKATLDSGYKTDIADISVSFMGVSMTSVNIKGADGFEISVQNAELNFNPFPLTLKNLALSLDAETVQIHQWPEEKNSNDSKAVQNFTVPDIFFNKINASVDIEELILPDNNTEIALSVTQSISQGNVGELRMNGNVKVSIDGQDMLPKVITNQFILTDSSFKIAAFNVIHDDYNLTAQGVYDLQGEQADLHLVGQTDYLGHHLFSDIGSVKVEAALNGSLTDMAGQVTLISRIREDEVHLDSPLALTDQAITFKQITGGMGDMALNGQLTLPYDTALIDGQISVNTSNPAALLTLVGVNEEVKGAIEVRGLLKPEDGKQTLSLIGDITTFDWQGLSAEQVSLQADINNLYSFALPALDVRASDMRYGTTQVEALDGRVMLGEQGDYKIMLQANGRERQEFALNANATIESFSPLSVIIDTADLKLKEGLLSLSGRMNEDRLDFTLSGADITPDAVPFASLPRIPIIVSSLSITASGSPKSPVIDGRYSVVTTHETMPTLSVNGDMSYRQGKAKSSFGATGEGIEKFETNITLPIQLSLYPFGFDGLDTATIDGKIAAVFEARALKAFLPDNGYDINGMLRADARLSGTLDSIQMDGEAVINQARFYDPNTGINLKDIESRIVFNKREAIIEQFSALGEDERGRISMEGRIGFVDIADPDIDISLNAKDAHILSGPPYDVRLNADIVMADQGNEYLVSGDLSLGEVNIQLPENRPRTIPQLNIVKDEDEGETPLLEKIKLDLAFEANDKIFVRGYGVDTEMAGSLKISGYASDPQINGELSSVRGRYEEFGRQFELEQAIVRFQGSVPPSPYLDIIAATRIDDVTAKVNMGGTPAKPRLSFTSEPAMPEDEVLSYILFGEDIATISPFQAIQLANTLGRLSGRGSVDLNILGSIRDATGLDDIRIEGTGEDARLGAGKYISDNVYLDVSKGIGEESGSARLEIELTPSISVEGKVGQAGESDTNIFWRWDY